MAYEILLIDEMTALPLLPDASRLAAPRGLARVPVKRFVRALCVAALLAGTAANAESAGNRRQIPILVYHRFGPVVADSMTVTTAVFESQLEYLKDNGYSVIPLRQLVDYFRGTAPPPAPRSIVITADDGHRSLYTEMLPLVVRYRVPVTLFIYPSAISRADYAMTWEQLRVLQRTGLFDIQSHTYWHPNFKKEKRRLTPREYEAFVTRQFTKSRAKLREELGVRVDMLAWPFGIYDDELIELALKAGYVAAVSLDRRRACGSDNIMALPRYLMTNVDKGTRLGRLLSPGRAPTGGAPTRVRTPALRCSSSDFDR